MGDDLPNWRADMDRIAVALGMVAGSNYGDILGHIDEVMAERVTNSAPDREAWLGPSPVEKQNGPPIPMARPTSATVADHVRAAVALMRASNRGEVSVSVKVDGGHAELTLPENRHRPDLRPDYAPVLAIVEKERLYWESYCEGGERHDPERTKQDASDGWAACENIAAAIAKLGAEQKRSDPHG